MRPYEKPSPSIVISIQPHLLGAIERYVFKAIPPGDFLTACFENDLRKAVMYADDTSSRNLKNIVKYIFNYTPSICWGSPESVRNWYEMPRHERDTVTAYFQHLKIRNEE